MSNTQEDLSWSNLDDQALDLGIGTGGDFFTIEDGENIVRVLSAPVHYGQYFLGKGIQPVFAKNADEEFKKDKKVTHKFSCYVFNYKTNKIEIADFGWSVAGEISKLAKSSQYQYEGIPPFDIIITKTGSGMSTKYSVTPGRNEDPMNSAVIAELNEKQSIKEFIDAKIAKQAGEDINPNATIEEKEMEGGIRGNGGQANVVSTPFYNDTPSTPMVNSVNSGN